MGPGKQQYRIAFFTVDWNYELVESTLHGLKRYVDDHENIYIYIFDCLGKDLDNAKDKSEYIIFDLPDLRKFDGVLVQGNQIVLKRVRDAIERRIVEAGVPAVSIGAPMAGCSLIRFDNRAAQRAIVDHVIRDHHAERLVYLTGNTENGSPEARERLDGFEDACRENNIRKQDVQIIPATWRTSDGTDLADTWIREKREMPDAFICANDEMAIGLMTALKNRGIRIPQDVIVTGFDNLSSSELSSPRLSTVGGDNQAQNYQAMDMLISLIDVKDSRKELITDYHVVCSESCGCSETARPDTIRELYFQQTRFLKDFYNLQGQMAEDLFEANNLQELVETVGKNRRIFGCQDIYLCFNDYYFDHFDKSEWPEEEKPFGEEMILAVRKNGHLFGDGNENYEFIRFPTGELLPETLLNRERFMMFYPLHYNTYSIGYIALDGISDAAKMNLHESIFNFLEIAIENVRKKELLRQFNETLDELYVRDSLTGLYNRFGLKRFGQETFDWLMERDSGAQVLFTDMDDMKLVNDLYGHNAGDEALKASAWILSECCDPEDVIIRYGGDEFVIIAQWDEKDLKKRILAAADEYNRSSGMPFQLGFSIGTCSAEASEGKTMDDCIKVADAQMYEVKTERKAGR